MVHVPQERVARRRQHHQIRLPNGAVRPRSPYGAGFQGRDGLAGTGE
jgi:hypothetical protein